MFKIVLTTLVMLSLVSPELRAVPGAPADLEKQSHLPPVYHTSLQHPLPVVGQPPHQAHPIQPAPPANTYALGSSHRMCNLVGRWVGCGIVAATLAYFIVIDHMHH